MALVVYDRVQETTATTGTGTITLGGAVAGYQSFAVVGNGNTTFYCIVNNSAWEVGIGTYSTTGPTLARTTVLSNSNGDTSPINLSGASNVFVTYPSEKSVNLDASGNVSALGTISSGTWQGSAVGVAYGGTGVTASSGANSVVLRDSNANITFNNFIAGAAAVTASGTTTVLTAASSRTQILVGSTNQTFQLPNATTLALGQSFIFVNNSSGTLTVKDNSGATVESVPAGGVTQMGATSIATSAGTWGSYSFIPAAVDWGTNGLNLATTVITGGTWNGGTIQSGYGGTGLTSFTSGGAIYATSTSALTSGTLPVTAGGTGQTAFTSGYIPYGNSSAALQSSNLLQFNGSYLQVGGGSVLGGTTNPIAAFSQSANNYVQTYTYNPNTGTSTSADFVAYTNNSTDASGWADMGFTSSNYSDATYSVTGPNEAYLFGSAPSGAGKTGNLVYATDSTGSANAHQWYVGGFNQAKGSWKMQLTSTGLQLANALAVTYGGTGATTLTGYVYGNGTSAMTASTTIPNSGLANSSVTVNSVAISLGGSGTITANTSNALTMNNSGAGAVSGTTFNGSSAQTISYNTIGAAPTAGSTSITTLGTISTGTWNANTIATTYGGTGLTGFTAANNAIYSTSSSALTAGTLPVAAGGTGLTSTPANGALDIGNGTGFTRTTLTAGTGITITNGAGSISIASSAGNPIPAGTVMLFYQSAAPTGWTQVTTVNDVALRIVSGTGGTTGGTTAFSSVFANQTPSFTPSNGTLSVTAGTLSVGIGTLGTGTTTAGGSVSLSAGGSIGATTLSTGQMPSHNHGVGFGAVYGGGTPFIDAPVAYLTPPAGYTEASDYTGGSGSHSHGFTNPSYSFSGTGHNHTVTGSPSLSGAPSLSGTVGGSVGAVTLNVAYANIIICSKN